MSHAISRRFHARELLTFALPSMVMMIFLSLYTIVDGFFVSRFVGTDALSAVNITYPLTSVFVALGVMFATGGSAAIARLLGEGRQEDACRGLSLIFLAAVGLGTVGTVVCLGLRDPILVFLGAGPELMDLCRDYITVLMLFFPASILQMLFQNFLVTAGRPGLGFGLTVAAGLANMVLDYLFIVPGGMGIAGAAWATGIGYCIPALGGLVFFFVRTVRREGLRFLRPRWEPKLLWQSATNGSSEMVTNLSTSITTLVFNRMMMQMAGADGVAAITVVLYSQFLLTALFMGFSIGVAPVISYWFGAGDGEYLSRLERICWRFILAVSGVTFAVGVLLSEEIATAFCDPSTYAHQLIAHGMKLFSLSFLFAGVNIFGSAFFTALSDGKASAAISFARTFLLLLPAMLVLPLWLSIDGLWLSVPLAELLTVGLVRWLLCRCRPIL